MRVRERERQRCRERLEALVDAPLGVDEVRHAAIGALRRAVGFERWCWPLTDPESGLSTSGIGEFDFWPSLPQLVALEEHGDTTTKPGLFLGERASVALSSATGGDLARSARWRECLEPYGIGDELMTVCRDRHGGWGSVELMRDGGDEPFTDADADYLDGLAPTLGALLRRSLARGTAATDSPAQAIAPAVVVLDRDLGLRSWTSTFQAWTAELPAVPGTLPAAIYEIGARARTPPARATPLVNRVRVQTSTGRWAVLEGALLEGASAADVAITIRPAHAAEMFDLLCRVYGLSRRERELAALVLEGLDTKRLAGALSISSWTVQDHLKSLFGKTGTRTRGELVSQLTAAPRADRLRAGESRVGGA
jgi:DNA-binding CsgD family transcriptional regulator